MDESINQGNSDGSTGFNGSFSLIFSEDVDHEIDCAIDLLEE